MDRDKIVITTGKIKKYRETIKKLGIWDGNYDSIKNDLHIIRNNLIDMNLSYDVAGVLIEIMILGQRLLTYGESEIELSIGDIESLMSPIGDIETHTGQTFSISSDPIGFIKNAIPLAFDIMSKTVSKRWEINAYKKAMRSLMMATLELPRECLGRAMALDFCLSKYGLKYVRDNMAIDAQDMILKIDNAFVNEVLKRGESFFHGQMDVMSTKFIVSVCSILDGLNYGSIDSSQVTGLFTYMRKEAKLHNASSFIEFIDGRDFNGFSEHLLSYHGIGEDNDKS